MDDAEVVSLVARHVGLQKERATVERLHGQQGLLVCRVRFESGRSYVLKVSGTNRGTEPAIAWALSRIVPDETVRVVAYALDLDRDLQWAVMEDLGATRVRDMPTVATLCAMAKTLARIQIATLNRLDELMERGLPRILVSHWVSIALDLLERIADQPLQEAGKRDAQRCAWSVEELFAAASLWPESIVHGDLHAGNASIVSSNPLAVKLLDWGSAYIGPAQLGLAELLLSAPPGLQQPQTGDQVTAAYHREWEAVVGRVTWRRAKALSAAKCLVALQALQSVLCRPDADDFQAEVQMAAACSRLHTAVRSWLRLTSIGCVT